MKIKIYKLKSKKKVRELSDLETKNIISSKKNNIDMDNLMNSIHNSRTLYKELSKKCHPDRFINDPKQKIAEEKLPLDSQRTIGLLLARAESKLPATTNLALLSNVPETFTIAETNSAPAASVANSMDDIQAVETMMEQNPDLRDSMREISRGRLMRDAKDLPQGRRLRTLARRILLEAGERSIPLHEPILALGRTVGEELMATHRCYAPSVLPLLEEFDIRGMAHITGGGFYDNIPRILPADCSVTIERRTWPIPPIFSLIEERGNVPVPEMFRIFNMGIGLVLIVAPEHAPLRD